ncbi:MAG: LysM peptidoglycan-binding domain-containing protein, partial [Ginsengibacter sp.]
QSLRLGNLTINGSKAIAVPKGTSLLAIATQHNINLAKLVEINDLDKDGLLEKDQIIFLEKKQKEGSRDYYISQQKETLYDVSQNNGVLMQSICDLNKLSREDIIYPGTKILLRPAPVNGYQASANTYAEPPSKRGASSLKPVIHEVQPKEGLYTISKKYGVSVAQLREWNSLENDNLKIGQQLIISK